MQKKLIALAVAAAVAAPMAASAAPTIYGKLHFSGDYIDDDNTGDSDDLVSGASRASRLGFKGSEALGGSLKAIWQVEMGLNTSVNTSGTSNVKLRNTFAGLSGNWGTVLLGRHDTPYKIATGKLDPNADRISDYNNIMGTTPLNRKLFDQRAPQTIAYITPNFSGFHAAAAYIEHKFNEKLSSGQGGLATVDTTDFEGVYGGGNCIPDGNVTSGNVAKCANDDENRAFSLMGMWERGNWFVSGAYEYHEGANFKQVTGQDFNRPDEGIAAYKLGLGWKPGNWQLGAVVERIDDSQNDSPNSRDAVFGTVGYKFGKNVVQAGVAYADKSDANCYSTSFVEAGSGDRNNPPENNTNVVESGYVDPSFSGPVPANTVISGCDDKAINYSLSLNHNFSKRTTIYAAFSYMDNDDDATYGLETGTQIGDGYGPKRPGDSPRSVSLGIIHKF